MSYVDHRLADIASKKSLSKKAKRDALDKHYIMFRKFVGMTCREGGKSMIVNGNAGMGKTEFTNDVVKEHAQKKRIKCGKISGTLSSVMLFENLYHHRKKGQILIVDDTDKILEDTESLEILKAALDTKEDNIVDWSKYSVALKKRNVQTKFAYEGKIIIITNKMLRTAPDDQPTVTQQRIEPLMSRVHYFRAGLPDTSWKVEAIRMFAEGYESKFEDGYKYQLRCADDIELHDGDRKTSARKGGSPTLDRQRVLDEIVDWISDNADDLREVSFRTVAKLIQIRNLEPLMWQDMAMVDLGI
ncbi:MAG: hypothetical protein CMM16_02655 [Rhodospirillaceae bacterium]|nr:hypothetical protein [Rhodospirillaceae bacterium]